MNKMKIKRLLSVLVILATMVYTLAGCGSGKTNDSNAAEVTDSATNTTDASKMYTIKMVYLVGGTEPKDLGLVQEEINKITMEKIGAKFEFVPISMSQLSQQYTLMISSGQQLDVALCWPSFTSMQASGQLMPLDDLLNEYGTGIKDALGTDYLKACSVDGKVYSVASVHDLAKDMSIIMRKDIVDKYNIDINSLNSLEDVDDVFATVKAGEPDMLMVNANQQYSIVEGFQEWDNLGGDNYGVLMNQGQDTTVVNLYETDFYKERLQLVRNWYLKGYINEDWATSTLSGSQLMQQGKLFAMLGASKPGLLQQSINQCGGIELVEKKLTKTFATTSTANGVTWGIPVTCKNPEIAMQFMNLMWTDPDVINLLDWGIEGVHYVKTDIDNVIDYPEGVDQTNSGYCDNIGWAFGNQTLSYVWAGNDPDLYEQLKEFNTDAEKSLAMGFVPDYSNLKTQMTAIANAYSQYGLALGNGSLDIDENYSKFIDALKLAGIDDVIKEKQEQLDAYLEANK